MIDVEHQKIIDEVIGLARQQLKQDGMLDFTVLTIDEQGLPARMDIDTEFFRSEANKDRLKRKLRQDFREKGIVRYALVAECWMGTMKPISSAPVRSKNLEHYLDGYTDDRLGYSPSEGRGLLAHHLGAEVSASGRKVGWVSTADNQAGISAVLARS
jgi:hypothetical protein